MEPTVRVFWAVTQVMTEVPCTPTDANDFRSAWITAPPPESLPAIVSAVRTRAPMEAAGLSLMRDARSSGGRTPLNSARLMERVDADAQRSHQVRQEGEMEEPRPGVPPPLPEVPGRDAADAGGRGESGRPS